MAATVAERDLAPFPELAHLTSEAGRSAPRTSSKTYRAREAVL